MKIGGRWITSAALFRCASRTCVRSRRALVLVALLQLGCAAGNWLHYSPQSYEAAQGDEPGKVDANTYKVLGEVEKLSGAGQHSDAVAKLDDLAPLVDKKPLDRALVAQARAYVLMTMGNHLAAIPSLEEAIDASALPEKTRQDLRYNLVQIYVQDQQYAKAAPLLEYWIANQDHPEPNALALLGYIHLQQKAYPLAQDYLRRALSARPHERGWQEMLLACYYEQKDYTAAKKVLLQLIAQDPLNQETWISLARLEFVREAPQDALVSLELASSAQSLQATELEQLARLYMMQNAPQSAAKLLQQAMDEGQLPAGLQELELLAKAQLSARNYRAAYASYERMVHMLRPGKRMGQLCLQLASLASHMEMDEQVVHDARCTLEHADASGVASAQLMLGISLYRLRKFKPSLVALKAAMVAPQTTQSASQWYELVLAQQENYRVLHPSTVAARDKSEPDQDVLISAQGRVDSEDSVAHARKGSEGTR